MQYNVTCFMLSLITENKYNMLIFFIYATILTLSFEINADEFDSFQAGQTISANKINNNFNIVNSRLNELSVQIDEVFSNDSNYTPTVMGLSDPKIFGQVSFNEGISACSVKYENSHICSFTDLNRAKNIPNLDDNIPAFIIKSYNGGTSDKLDIGFDQQICEDFMETSRSEKILFINSHGQVEVAFDTDFYTTGANAVPEYILQWVQSKNLVNGQYDADDYENADSYWQSGSVLRIHSCNTTMPTLCCK